METGVRQFLGVAGESYTGRPKTVIVAIMRPMAPKPATRGALRARAARTTARAAWITKYPVGLPKPPPAGTEITNS